MREKGVPGKGNRMRENTLTSGMTKSCSLRSNCERLPPAELGIILHHSKFSYFSLCTYLSFRVFFLNNELILLYIKKKRTLVIRKKVQNLQSGMKGCFTCSGFQLALLWCLLKQITARKQRQSPPPQPKKWLPLQDDGSLPGNIMAPSSSFLKWLIHAKEPPSFSSTFNALFPEQTAINKWWVCPVAMLCFCSNAVFDMSVLE
jgi:hypothetical protein